jgi:hypothetical protein
MKYFLTCLLLLVAVSANAQSEDRAFEGQQLIWPEFEDAPPDAPTARVGFAFDLVSRSREAAITVGEPVEVMLVAWDVQVALQAWEVKVLIDERLTVVEEEHIADLHFVTEGDVRGMLKAENCNASAEIVLARYKLLLLEEANDLVLGIGPATGPTVVTHPTDTPQPSPIYQICRENGDMRPFLWSDVSAVLNPVNVHPDPVEGEQPRFAPEPVRGRQ